MATIDNGEQSPEDLMTPEVIRNVDNVPTDEDGWVE